MQVRQQLEHRGATARNVCLQVTTLKPFLHGTLLHDVAAAMRLLLQFPMSVLRLAVRLCLQRGAVVGVLDLPGCPGGVGLLASSHTLRPSTTAARGLSTSTAARTLAWQRGSAAA